MNMSEMQRMIEREDERLARSTGISLRVTRRSFLVRTAALAAAWTICPWRIGVPSASGQGMDQQAMTQTLDLEKIKQTLEAFADTLIPGQKRFPGDRAIAGVVSGPGAVQAGAIEMMNFAPVGLQGSLSDLAQGLDFYAEVYAFFHKIKLDPTVPAFVSLDFEQRTALLIEILAVGGLDPRYYGLASVAFLAYHTAGYLPTVVAIRDGHPGLAAIGFPAPDPDGVWRFPKFSYRRVLAVAYPGSHRGNPP